MKGLGKLIYELPSTNILNKVTLEHQHIHLMIENTTHLRFFFLIFLFHFIFFLHIYKRACSERKQISSQDEVKNG